MLFPYRLFVYYLGVVKALKAAGLHKNAYLIASSGGASACHAPTQTAISATFLTHILRFSPIFFRSVAGCTLFFDVDLDAMVEYVCGCAAEARASLFGAFRLRSYVAGAIARFAPRHTTPAALHGNMEVSVTVLPTLRNARITDFSTFDAMRTHLLATACIVPLAGLPMWVPGVGLVLDGGVSDLQPVRGWRRSGSFCRVHEGWGSAEAVAVSACPFYMSRASIRPDAFVPPLWAFYPPPPAQLRELYAMGTRNAAAWVASRHDGHNASDVPQTPPPASPHSWAHRAEEYAAAAAAAARAAAAGAAEEAGRAAAAAMDAAAAAAHHAAADAARFASDVAVAGAASSSAAARRTASRLSDFRTILLRCLACILVYCELVAQAGVSAATAALLPVCCTGVPRARAVARARSFLAPLPSLASYALSAPRSERAKRLAAAHAAALGQMSLLYRLLAHVMV
jgi:hypothetical protein